MGTKTIKDIAIAVVIKGYSPQLSDLSETPNDLTNHIFEQFY